MSISLRELLDIFADISHALSPSDWPIYRGITAAYHYFGPLFHVAFPHSALRYSIAVFRPAYQGR